MALSDKNLVSLVAAEHVGPNETGDNVDAKRVVVYAWDDATQEWRRSTGEGSSLAVRLDDTTTADVTYIGKAAIGSTTSAAVWQIAKLDTATGLIKTWADGDASFNNVWDNRATTVTYS